MDPFHPYFGIEWYWLLGAWAALSIGAHMWQVGYIVRLIRLGGPDDRFNAWPVRMREFLRDWLGQVSCTNKVISPLRIPSST